jgi:hypothetical protein
MNPKVLTKYYDQLTARERLMLLVAASVRGDPVERQRLLDSAPRAAYLLPHHHALAQALSEAATMHLLTLLEVAANFWQWWGLWGWSELRSQRRAGPDQAGVPDAEEAEDEQAEVVRVMCMVRYQAYLFVTHQEGWKQFCQAWPLEPEALLQIKPGWDMVVRTEAQAREHAYAPEDAAMFLLSELRLPEEDLDEEFELPQVLTVADVAQAWHTVIDLQVKTQQAKDKC